MTREHFLQANAVIDDWGLKLHFRDRVYDLMANSEEPIVKQGLELLFANFPISTVIEIGFGLGFTAKKFQELGVSRHYILEPHPEIFLKAQEWRDQQPNKNDIILINEFWQDWRRLDGPAKIHTDLVYYDVAEWIMTDAYDFPRIVQEVLPSYFKWGGLIAGYARENCEVSEFINKIDFILKETNYIQPYREGCHIINET